MGDPHFSMPNVEKTITRVTKMALSTWRMTQGHSVYFQMQERVRPEHPLILA